eukprot:scaffold2009_cov370-Prasinococcus_capsulatus_cf.AAC.13
MGAHAASSPTSGGLLSVGWLCKADWSRCGHGGPRLVGSQRARPGTARPDLPRSHRHRWRPSTSYLPIYHNPKHAHAQNQPNIALLLAPVP